MKVPRNRNLQVRRIRTISKLALGYIHTIDAVKKHAIISNSTMDVEHLPMPGGKTRLTIRQHIHQQLKVFYQTNIC